MIYCKDDNYVSIANKFVYEVELYYNDLRYFMLIGNKLYESDVEIPIKNTHRSNRLIIYTNLISAPKQYLDDNNYKKIKETKG